MVIVCLASAQALSGQSRWDRQVDARFTQAAATLGRAYRIAGRGTLSTGETATFTITLPPQIPTVLTGVCDEDCVDLDLSLETNGYETDAARGGGNAPILQATPVEATLYRVTVRMSECRKNPCWYAVGIFRRSVTSKGRPSP